ncbi:MAG: hypothetical protein ABI584_14935 [Acidobacteriota bacterium]
MARAEEGEGQEHADNPKSRLKDRGLMREDRKEPLRAEVRCNREQRGAGERETQTTQSADFRVWEADAGQPLVQSSLPSDFRKI